MKTIRLILIEDNRLLREGIKAILEKETGIDVIATFDDTDFVLEEIDKLQPDVVLLDLGLTNKDSLELVKSLKESYVNVKVIVMDLAPIQEDIFRFVEAGVSGFILKDAMISDFTNTISLVAGGEKVLPPILTGSLFSQIMDYGIKELGPAKVSNFVRMTRREREIVDLIAEGLSNKEIAQNLSISIYTVKSHVHNILEKLALNSRVQIAIHASSSREDS